MFQSYSYYRFCHPQQTLCILNEVLKNPVPGQISIGNPAGTRCLKNRRSGAGLSGLPDIRYIPKKFPGVLVIHTFPLLLINRIMVQLCIFIVSSSYVFNLYILKVIVGEPLENLLLG